MKIAVLDDYQGVALELADWSRLDADVTVFRDTITGAALTERLAPFDVVCVMRERTPLPADLIAALPNLKLIVSTGRRNASISMDAAQTRGICVMFTGARAVATVHHTLSLILATTRGLAAEAISMRNGGWQTGLGRDLHGLTLGLIGLGRLGAQVAALARPFGMRLCAWSANLTDARCAEIGVRRMESLADLLAASDVASIHLALSDRTKGLIDADALRRMKTDAVLINTSRGPIVDADAVLDALRADRLGAAALDVYETEPLPANAPIRDAALIDAGKLILTPHMGYVSKQTYQTFYTETVEAIAQWRRQTDPQR